MRKSALIVIGISLAITLAACGSQATPATAAAPESASALPSNYDNALPPLSQLVVGSFRLEGSEAIAGEQAKQLATLWRGYRSLSQSDSASRQELAGLQAQLEHTMTPEQLQAITAMQLTRDDLTTVMSELGVEAGAGRNTELTDEERANFQALRSAASGQRGNGGGDRGPGGGPPPADGPQGGAFANPDGAGLPAEQQTLIAQRSGNGGGLGGPMVDAGLLDKLIAMLEAK